MSNSETKRPTHIAYAVIGDGDKTHWHRIGAAWANKDGKGLNIVFDSLPLNGRVVLREADDKDNGGQQ
jgi:hypothetical protein